jgi:hypothetical protein
VIINKISEFIKRGLKKGEEHTLFKVLLIIFVALFSFGLGAFSEKEKSAFPVKILGHKEGIYSKNIEYTAQTLPLENGGSVLGSKNGTKYHLPWCAGASRIKEENKIWFSSPEEAERAGYEPAANCPGI